METVRWKALTLSLSGLAPGRGHLGFPEAACPNPNPLTASRASLRPRGTQRSLAGCGWGQLPSPFPYPRPHHPAAGAPRAGLRPIKPKQNPVIVKLPLGQAPARRRSPLCLPVPCSSNSKLAEAEGQQSHRRLSFEAAAGRALTHLLNFK